MSTKMGDFVAFSKNINFIELTSNDLISLYITEKVANNGNPLSTL
jgi:hypothetical protein